MVRCNGWSSRHARNARVVQDTASAAHPAQRESAYVIVPARRGMHVTCW